MIAAALAAALLSAAAPPSDLAVGQPAPPLAVAAWLNVPGSWSEKELAGKVVMVEFWGTWCAPCVRAMPHVQELSDRYRDRGLVVVALSYEPPPTLKPFLEKNSYTMPVACDTAKACVAAYGVKSWPSTFVIDRAGKIAFVGGPYDVEPAIEAALGIESSPGSLLTAYLAALRLGDATVIRSAIQRLHEKAPSSFDLRAWADERKAAQPDAAVEGGDPETAALLATAAKDATPFNLHAWVCTRFGQSFPLDAKEMGELLKAQRYQGALEALLDRNPSASALMAAMKSKELKAFCAQKQDEYASLARKALMAEHWVFQERQPKDNDAFWAELSVSGVSTSPDTKQVVGILLAGAAVVKAEAAWYADRHQRLGLVAEAIADGKNPSLAKLPAAAAALSKKVLAELEAKY